MKLVHPDAMDVLLKYGKDYSPVYWRTPPPEPKPRSCFLNAWILSNSNNYSYVYVEGIAMGPVVPPMLHAWNTMRLRSTRAVDWTHYPITRWSRYLGIPLTKEEYAKLSRSSPLKGGIQLLFHKDHFTEKVRDTLIEILENRTRRR